LSLVIGGAPRIDVTVPNVRGEGRSNPFIQGIRGLNVVMPVDKKCGQTGSRHEVPADHRMTRSFTKLCLKSQFLEFIHHPFCTLSSVLSILRVSAHTGNPQKVGKLCHIALTVGVNLFHNSLGEHGCLQDIVKKVF
jgi:hypothetical protein